MLQNSFLKKLGEINSQLKLIQYVNIVQYYNIYFK